MKQFTVNSLMAAAAAVLAAGSASAQSLKADIPFTFHAAGAVMTAGTYKVVEGSRTAKYVVLRNTDTKQAVLAVYESTDPAKDVRAKGTPALQFECSGSNCALRGMWTGAGNAAYRFRGPKPGSDTRMAVIPLTSTKAD